MALGGSTCPRHIKIADGSQRDAFDFGLGREMVLGEKATANDIDAKR